MQRWLTRFLLLAAASTTTVAVADDKLPAAVDLARYAGTWHEIARMPQFFQRKCVRDVTATYTLDGDYVQVRNRCVTADGRAITADGRARIVDAPTNRKLKVGFLNIFGWWPFEGDYWILALDPDYRWVIIGGPDQDYGWILARTSTITPELRAQLDALLTDFGYDPKKFVSGAQPR